MSDREVFALSAMPKFQLGELRLTAGIDAKMKEDEAFRNFVQRSFNRYSQCDWGDTCEDDRVAADEAVKTGHIILAVYIFEDSDTKIWIITDYGHAVTTILFPHEY